MHIDLTLADGLRAAKHLLALPQPPDAIFLASDFAALGCLQELQASGRQVPAEVGVVGFSDEFFCQCTEPALSSVNQCSEQLGYRAVQRFLELKEMKTTWVIISCFSQCCIFGLLLRVILLHFPFCKSLPPLGSEAGFHSVLLKIDSLSMARWILVLAR